MQAKAELRIVTLNIRQGGGQRVAQILEYVSKLDAEILCLTEYRQNARGEELQAGLRAGGYQAWHTNSSTNGVLIAVRQGITAMALSVPPSLENHVLFLNVGGIRLGGLYFPQKELKRPVFKVVQSCCASWLGGPALLLGDLNTGLHFKDEVGQTFYCADELIKLLDQGWKDAFRLLHPKDQAFSWFSRKGAGFRIDHTLVSPFLQSKVRAAGYDQAPRRVPNAVSDHAAMIVELAFAGI